MSKSSFPELRLKRLRHGITAREMAQRLDASYGWVRSLEKGFYRGPSRKTWLEKYSQALEETIKERKEAKS